MFSRGFVRGVVLGKVVTVKRDLKARGSETWTWTWTWTTHVVRNGGGDLCTTI